MIAILRIQWLALTEDWFAAESNVGLRAALAGKSARIIGQFGGIDLDQCTAAGLPVGMPA